MQITVANLADAVMYPFLFITGYITTCFILNHYQAHLVHLYMQSPTYKSFLKYTTIAHNTGLIVFSAYMCIVITNVYVQGEQYEPYVMNLCWVFTYSKIWEFLDTYLILLKGQTTIFLQKYHHVGALLCWWLCCYYKQPAIYQPSAVNAFIHTIMYSYYLASLLGYKWTSIKPYITSMQLLQFFACGYMAAITYFIPAINSANSIQDLLLDGACMSFVIFYIYLAGLIYLFLQFFVKEYCNKKPKIAV